LLAEQLGADIDGKDYDGMTPLMHASYTNELNMMEKLLDSGADVHVHDAHGDTALHHAMHNGVEEQVRLMLKFGANVFATNKCVCMVHVCFSPILYVIWASMLVCMAQDALRP
jgi:ankyrin repeat protein